MKKYSVALSIIWWRQTVQQRGVSHFPVSLPFIYSVSKAVHSHVDDSTFNSSSYIDPHPFSSHRWSLVCDGLGPLCQIWRLSLLGTPRTWLSLNSKQTQILFLSLKRNFPYFELLSEGSFLESQDSDNIYRVFLSLSLSWKPHTLILQKIPLSN